MLWFVLVRAWVRCFLWLVAGPIVGLCGRYRFPPFHLLIPPLQCGHCHSSPTPGAHCGEHLSCERWVFLPTAGSAVTRRTELRGLVQLYACGGGGLILYLLVSCDVGCCSWCNGEIVRYTASGNSRPVATPACRWPVNDLDGEPEALVGLGAVSRESRG